MLAPRISRGGVRPRDAGLGGSVESDGTGRAGADTGATACAAVGVNLGHGNPPRLRRKMDRVFCAAVSANPALDPLFRQAEFADCGANRPRQLSFAGNQGTAFARRYTFSAEGTFALREIDDGTAVFAVADDLCWANLHALAAARTGLEKTVFGEGPGRTLGTLALGKSAKKEIASA